ncbi:MAG TPA: ABC transporter substrate-binding protein, partial [Minicystis sp.]|nr:ABC transporter substrate-binding protein [Minicystis sp.]
GAMFPTSGPDAVDIGTPSLEAVDLARRDFVETSGGLPPARAGGPRRPIGVVLCDDARDPTRAAAHLVEELRVPAVIGFARSKEVADLALASFLPKGVLALAANTASLLRTIPTTPGEPRLVYRTTTSAEMLVPPDAALVSDVLEPALRAEPGALAKGEAMRVALVRVGNASGTSASDAYLARLRIGGKTVAEDPSRFRQLELRDGLEGAALDAAVARVAAELAAFRPHVVVMWTEADVIPALERAWPAGARFRPRYVGVEIDAALTAFVAEHPELGRRIFMTDLPSTARTAKFVLRHDEVFPHRASPRIPVMAPYDAFYVVAYAAAAAGAEPLSGRVLARGIRRLLPPGEAVDVGPGGIYPAFGALASGKNVDLAGLATTLDFDLATGDPTADFAIYCASPVGAVETGLVYRAAAQRLEGTLRCP